MKRVFVVAVGVAAACALAAPASAQFGGLGGFKKAIEKAKEVPKPETKAPEKLDEKKAEEPKAEEPKAEEKADASEDTKAKPAAPAADANGQPEMKEVKIDFVPGEKTVFFDDFSDMAPDEPPPHWKVRGGTVSLKVGKDAHVLAPHADVTMTSGAIAVPKDFTFEITCDCKGEIQWKLENAENHVVIEGNFQSNDDQTHVTAAVFSDGELGSGEIKTQPGPLTFALWAQQGRVRAYLNGERVVDANQVKFAGADHLVLYPSRYRQTDIRTIRIAESTPDFSTQIANGKYVSHGIRFDTDSDKLLPDSAPVLKMIANGLIKNPNLKLAINGYTDSTGNADHNLDLSKRRAAAVKSVLVSQFAIDASRLSSDGFGAGQPIGSNDTPDGRAQNRRVEFVKQ